MAENISQYKTSDGVIHDIEDSYARDQLKNAGGTTSVAATLLVSGWSGTSAPYSYDLSTLVPSLTGESSVVLGYDGDSYSEDSYNAINDAGPILGGQGTTIKAYGDKPTVNIPVIIQYS